MQKTTQLFQFIKYKLIANNQHGVHSPFVYDLLLHAIYNNPKFYCFDDIEQQRKLFLNSTQTVNCNDLGAGSVYKNNPIKKVSLIAKYAAKPAKYGQLLFRIVNYFQPKIILELGTSLGITTSYLASANAIAKVISIEGCPEVATLALQNFQRLHLTNINLYIGNFKTQLPEVLQTLPSIDFVFFDGNHRKQPTLDYFLQCLPKTHNSSIFIIDDIYWSYEMKQAWQEIKNHPSVTVTIDLFYLGIVFFRKEQVKQHFVIRY